MKKIIFVLFLANAAVADDLPEHWMPVAQAWWGFNYIATVSDGAGNIARVPVYDGIVLDSSFQDSRGRWYLTDPYNNWYCHSDHDLNAYVCTKVMPDGDISAYVLPHHNIDGCKHVNARNQRTLGQYLEAYGTPCNIRRTIVKIQPGYN